MRKREVTRLLVTKGNEPVLPVGKDVTELKPGQIGVFDKVTNKSIDSSKVVPEFFIALGVDENGDGEVDNIRKSTGDLIQSRNIEVYNFRPHTAGKPMKAVLKDYVADCETEYGIRLEFINQSIYNRFGYTRFGTSYMIKTSCCVGCEQTCPSGDANEITKQLYQQVISDADSFVKVSILPRGSVSAAGVTPVDGKLTLEDVDTIMAYNKTQTDVANYVFTNLEFETIPTKAKDFCQINMNYDYPRETTLIVSKIEGFKCNGTVEITQKASFEEGSGYDIKQMESLALGLDNGKFGYRTSSITGLPFENNFLTDVTKKYDLISLSYNLESEGAWGHHHRNHGVDIAIPSDETTTRDSLLAILDNLIGTTTLLDKKADDATPASTDPEVVEPTEEIDDKEKDGLD